MSHNVTVLRPNYDSTNGGLSSKNDSLLVLEPTEQKPITSSLPLFRLSAIQGHPHIRPLTWDSRLCGPMAGGNYATGDSRFGEAVGRMLGTGPFYSAVSIHDRFESQELNDMMSR